MMRKTHIALAILGVLILLPFVKSKMIFAAMAVVATLLPDLDSRSSRLGRNPLMRPVQWITGHRGVLHSLTFCLLVSIALAIFIPILALGFFLGYSIHLFADSFTVMGISAFWPVKSIVSRGRIETGGRFESILLVLTMMGICLLGGAYLVSMFVV
ncbi:MAG: metal-dependent hydrolase [Candidatus Pacearchaeota archaeon]|jgi:inner membrane protein